MIKVIKSDKKFVKTFLTELVNNFSNHNNQHNTSLINIRYSFCDKNFIWQKLKRKKSSQLMMSIFDNDFRQMTHFFAHFRLLQMFLFLVITQLVFIPYSTSLKFIYYTRTSCCVGL